MNPVLHCTLGFLYPFKNTMEPHLQNVSNLSLSDLKKPSFYGGGVCTVLCISQLVSGIECSCSQYRIL